MYKRISDIIKIQQRLQNLYVSRLQEVQFHYLGQLFSKLVQFLLKGCPFGVGGSHLVPDLTDLRLDACRHDNANGPTSCYVGSLQGHKRAQLDSNRN